MVKPPKNNFMQPDKVTKRIKDKALELLDQFPNGLRYSELHSKISAFDTGFNSNTINGSIWNLDAIFPDKVYKPSKGLFRLLKHKPADEVAEGPAPVPPPVSKIKEEDFYEPFADWLTNEIEDVTVAIPLGGNKFKDKWGTPDVIGKRESRRSDIIKGMTEIVSAEIPVKPRDCESFCPYDTVCRIEKWRLPMILEEIKSRDLEDPRLAPFRAPTAEDGE